MSQHQATYTTGSVFKHISTLSLTSAIGLFAIFVVDLVDVFFISLLGEAELAAAVGFAGIGLFLGASVCIGIAVSLSTVVAQALGEADEDSARRLASNGMLYTLLWTVPTTVLTLYFAPELLSFIGASGRTLELAVTYFRIVGVSLPILGFAMAGSSLLRAVGDARMSMWSTLNGGIVNAVLDPIFIFTLGLGLSGAAIASVFSRITVAGVAIYGLLRKHEMLCQPDFKLFFSDAKQFNSIALPSLLTNLSGPVGSAFATAQMAKFGTDAVAAAAVIGRITPVAFAGLYGMSGAVGPIASQNFGAQAYGRLRETLLASLQFSALYVFPVALLLFLLQDWLIGIFSLEAEAAELLRFYATFIIASYFLFALQLAANPIFTALRHPGFSTVSNIVRDLLLALPLIYLGAGLYEARGIFAGQALANAIAGVLAFAVALWLTRRVEQGKAIDIKHLRTRWHHYRAIAPGVQHRGH